MDSDKTEEDAAIMEVPSPFQVFRRRFNSDRLGAVIDSNKSTTLITAQPGSFKFWPGSGPGPGRAAVIAFFSSYHGSSVVRNTTRDA